MKITILVVDDEKIQRESVAGYLEKKGYQLFTAPDAGKALEIASNNLIDVVLTDYKMGEKSGLDLLKNLKSLNPEIEVILMTAYGNISNAVEAMKAGAYDYLTKPIDLDELEILIKRASRLKQITQENRQLKTVLAERHRFSNILTGSRVMEETLNLALRAAESRAAILIEGESGTGKELIARAIHFASDRHHKPLVTVNCAALSENLLESELFGHEKGAFTGAVGQRAGLVEEAEGGTLFLDEIGDVPLTTQVKLLRFLQFGEFQRVGSNQTLKVDARLIAATNRDLKQLISENQFREDFYYRLNVISLFIPPLRQRKGDIPLLTDFFIKHYSRENEKPVETISREALDGLMKYDFPGNVRELENLIERAVVLSRESMLTVEDFPANITNVPGPDPQSADPGSFYTGSFAEKVAAFEIDLIKGALSEHNGNQSRAARMLGMTERNLRYKLNKYGLKEERNVE